MMMSDNKKKMATMIIAKMGPNGKEESQEAPKNENGDEMDSDHGYSAASEEIIQAVESKDPKALKHALKSFIEMCLAEKSDDSEY